jgi:hypothetical protein
MKPTLKNNGGANVQEYKIQNWAPYLTCDLIGCCVEFLKQRQQSQSLFVLAVFYVLHSGFECTNIPVMRMK